MVPGRVEKKVAIDIPNSVTSVKNPMTLSQVCYELRKSHNNLKDVVGEGNISASWGLKSTTNSGEIVGAGIEPVFMSHDLKLFLQNEKLDKIDLDTVKHYLAFLAPLHYFKANEHVVFADNYTFFGDKYLVRTGTGASTLNMDKDKILLLNKNDNSSIHISVNFCDKDATKHEECTGLHIDKEKIIISNKKDSSISIYDKRISLKGKEMADTKRKPGRPPGSKNKKSTAKPCNTDNINDGKNHRLAGRKSSPHAREITSTGRDRHKSRMPQPPTVWAASWEKTPAGRW